MYCSSVHLIGLVLVLFNRGFRVRKVARLQRCKLTGPSSPAEWDRMRSDAVSFVMRKRGLWEERKVPAKKIQFYYNSGSGESSWEQPASWLVLARELLWVVLYLGQL